MLIYGEFSCVCHRVVIWYLYKCCTDEMIYTSVHAMHASFIEDKLLIIHFYFNIFIIIY